MEAGEQRTAVDLTSLRSWTFLTNHAQVLLAVAGNPEASVVELAELAQITTRSAYRILADLQKAGYVRRRKLATRNRYELNADLPLGDPLVKDEPLGSLIAVLGTPSVERAFERALLARLPRRRIGNT